MFAAAISGSDAYDDQVHAMAVRNVSVGEALRTITVADVRDACDLLAPVAQRTGRDGRVSLEVSPGVARDTETTAAEAAHLWWLVDRPNLVSRVDTEIDDRLEKAGADPALKGKAALANAQLAYQAYEEIFSSDRWRALRKHGAQPHRPLWASTGVKNADYPDTLYVSDLIAPGTVTRCRRRR
ncbi:transaldolase family protein [Cryptosporangium sp. NPDC051539]|uniref:transaldolase family protein n=1 Tax=Cryptosporangium sp. NPDC051539 TaxID=3363962 RepID=UPI003789E409